MKPHRFAWDPLDQQFICIDCFTIRAAHWSLMLTKQSDGFSVRDGWPAPIGVPDRDEPCQKPYSAELS